MKTFLTLCGLAAALGSAQASDIGGPVAGYTIDGRSHSIRMIEGIPGAARLGAPLSLPFAIGTAAVSAQRDYALVTDVNGDGHLVLARGLRSGAPRTSALAGAIAPAGISLSDSGAVAVLYGNAPAKVQFVTGLPDAPQALDPIDIAMLNGGVLALAADSAGRSALLAAADGGIYRTDGRSIQWVVRIPGAASVAFLPNGDDAVVASTAGEVLLLHGLSGTLSVRAVANASNGIQSARAVRALSDREIAVVDGAGGLAAIDLENSSVEWIGLAGAAGRIVPLDRNLLLLNEVGPQPLLLLDTTNGRAPYFVPADRNAGSHRK